MNEVVNIFEENVVLNINCSLGCKCGIYKIRESKE